MSFFSFSPELEHTVWVNLRETRGVFPHPVYLTERIDTEIALTCTVPGPLVEARLVKAFEDSLTCYPHASGRLRRRGVRWAIDHGARGVPFTFMTTDEPFNHYEYLHAPPPRVVNSCSCAGAGSSEAQWDEPLVRVRVTFCRTTNETTIGWSSSPVIGNAEFIYAFMHSLSQHYQHKPVSVSVLDVTPSCPSSTFEWSAATPFKPALAPEEEHQLQNAIVEALAPTHTSRNSTPMASRRSTSKISLSKFHFGYGPERTRVVLYGEIAEVGYSRYFTVPPVKLRDGSWDTNDARVAMKERETELVDGEEEDLVVAFPRDEHGESHEMAWMRGRDGERAKL